MRVKVAFVVIHDGVWGFDSSLVFVVTWGFDFDFGVDFGFGG